MNIGIPKETKAQEGRVALTPEAVRRLVEQGHKVCVEHGAGWGAGYTDDDYQAAGAYLGTAAQAWDNDLVIKVKEPLPPEYDFLRGQLLFTFLHLAGAPRDLTEALLRTGTTGLAYETLEDAKGHLPLLAPMSAIAGNMAALVGAYYLARPHGGRGVQLGQVLGERHGRVLIIGDGVVGYHAARSALGLGAEVVMLGLDTAKGERLSAELGTGFTYRVSSTAHIAAYLPMVDLLIGAVLRPGAKAAPVVDEAMVQSMQPGSVIVDVSIDQGGCIATSKPTTHADPVFLAHGVLHYGVTNMPGAYPRTATEALSRAVLPYALKLAQGGLAAVAEEVGFSHAVNTYRGHLTHPAVAQALGCEDRYRAFSDVYTL